MIFNEQSNKDKILYSITHCELKHFTCNLSHQMMSDHAESHERTVPS